MKLTTTHPPIKYSIDCPDPSNVELLDRGCLPMLHDMMRNGIWLDQGKCRRVGEELQARETELLSIIRDIAGWDVNPESGDQVAKFLYDELELHKQLPRDPELTKSGKRMTTGDEVLSAMVGLHPVVPVIIDARECNTLRTTFTTPLLEMAQRSPDGRIRTTFKYTTARTGRLSSEDPNLQNIPIRSVWGKRIREAFCAQPRPDGVRTVHVSVDLSQIEMRLAAHLSGDPNLCRIFWDGLDIHNQTASAIFRVALEDVTKVQRAAAKNLGFGILYRQTALGLQGAIFSAGGPFWSEEQCEALITGWYQVYHQVYEWACMQDSRMRRYGMNWDFVGRWRLSPGIYSTHERVRQASLREGGNFPIQGGAGAVLKIIMIMAMTMVSYYAERGVCLPLLQVHDELVFEVEERMAQDFVGDMRTLMGTAVELDVPLDASGDVARSWGECK